MYLWKHLGIATFPTDIFDKELGATRLERRNKAFKATTMSSRPSNNRKATIVLEHLIQASEVAHTMQHWHVYQKWNEQLFAEMYLAFVEGRSPKILRNHGIKENLAFL